MFRINKCDIFVGNENSVVVENDEKSIHSEYNNVVFLRTNNGCFININKISSCSQFRKISRDKKGKYDGLKMYALTEKCQKEMDNGMHVVDLMSLEQFDASSHMEIFVEAMPFPFMQNPETGYFVDNPLYKNQKEVLDYFIKHKNSKRFSFNKVKELSKVITLSNSHK